MKQVQIPDARILTQYVRFAGGLDLSSPALDMKPGNAIDAVNYEPGLLGGYKRIDGYERFDGRPAPSAASYFYLEGAFAAITVGSAVLGATSGASAIVSSLVDGGLCVTKVAGLFATGETIKVGGTAVGTLTSASLRGMRDVQADAIAMSAAADYYRTFIQPVPGSGPVRGAYQFNGVTYAMRNTLDGLACGLYKATSAGWTAVALGQEMQVAQPSRSVTTSGGAVNWTAHGLSTGSLVRFGGTIPSGATANTSYYVLAPAANTFQVSATLGGAAIALGDATGVTCLPQAQQLFEGDVVTGATSGVTATVKRIGLRTGDWASFGATATLALTGATGTFTVGEILKVGSAPKVSVLAANKAITLKPGGRFEFVVYNFTGALSTRRLYWADGVNPAMEFDGTTLLPIYTGMLNDAPKFIRAHKLKLFLSFGGSVQHSGDGSPYAWTVLSGADEIGIGDDITGMAVQAGDTLAIFARNSSYQLNGSTNNDFHLLPISSESGAIAYTVQTIGKTLALDDRGVISTDRTQAYGNFVQSTISEAIQPLIDMLRLNAIGSVAYRTRNQYRIFTSDGSGIVATFNDAGLVGFTRLQYLVRPTCFSSCEDGGGANTIYFGADNGYVYQADIGSSFDGAEIEAYLRLPFNHFGSPRLRKRFRKAVVEMSATSFASVRFQPEFSYGDPDVGSHRPQTADIGGHGGYWDGTDGWDQFYYDAQVVTAPEFSIEGSGLNMSVAFYSNSKLDPSHLLQGLLIHYSIRRLSR